MSDLPKRKIIKVIALLLSILLVWQSVVWANPDIFRRSTLQPHTLFTHPDLFDSCSHGLTACLVKFLAESEQDSSNHNIHRMAIRAEEAVTKTKEALLAEIEKKDTTPEDLAAIKRRIGNMFPLDLDDLSNGFFVIDLGFYRIRYYNPDMRGARDPGTLYQIEKEALLGKYLGKQELVPISATQEMKKEREEDLRQAIEDGYIKFVEEITSNVIKDAHGELAPDQTDQNLKYIILTDKNGELLYRINPNDEIFIGHFRDDRASYFALGLQRHGFKNLTGWIPFSGEYVTNGGEYILPKEAISEVSDNYFEILYKKNRQVRIVSENEKKKHVGRNAHGRREKLWPNEKQVSIPMKPTTCEYADVPEMNTREVADQVIEWLDDPEITDIIVNMLSSDMMKHTGNFKAAKKGNEITDINLGRIKVRIDYIRNEFLSEVEDILKEKGLNRLVKTLKNKDFNEFLIDVRNIDTKLAKTFQELSKKVSLLVITADHGASEAGLAAKLEGSNTAHTANPVPYIIYDPLRKKKVRLKEGKTIRNNASTLLHLLGYNKDIPECYEESLLPDSYEGYERRIVEIVLDGWGINPDREYPYDAIRLANTPNYDWLVENASFTQVAAHGEVIGLRRILSQKEGSHHDRGLQPGATDIGHLHLFSGRLIKQPICIVDELIEGGLLKGVFNEDKAEIKSIIEKMLRVIKEDKKFHHIAFSSEGGVHACLSHMYALMRLAKKLGMRKDQFVIHFVAEGRDVLIPRSAHLFLKDMQEEIDRTGIGVVASVFGRADWVRKDGYQHQTDRAVGALSGDFKMFVEGTRKMTGGQSVSPAGYIARGSADELYQAFMHQEKESPAKPLSYPFKRRLARVKKKLIRRVNESQLSSGTKIKINVALKKFLSVNLLEFNAIVLLDDKDRRMPRSWLLGFNTRKTSTGMDETTGVLNSLLRNAFLDTIGFSTEVLEHIQSDGLILQEYLLHEAICPLFGHERSRTIQEELFPENYEDILGDAEEGHSDGELALALKQVIWRKCQPFPEETIDGEKINKEFDEYEKLGFTGKGPQEASHYYTRFSIWREWIKRVWMAMQSRLNKNEGDRYKAQEWLGEIDEQYKYVLGRVNDIWNMEILWGKVQKLLEGEGVFGLSERKFNKAKPVLKDFLEKYEQFIKKYPTAEKDLFVKMTASDILYRVVAKVVDKAKKDFIKQRGTPVKTDKRPLPESHRVPQKEEKKPEKEPQETEVSFKEKGYSANWKDIFVLLASGLAVSFVLYFLLPVNWFTVLIATVAQLALFIVLIVMNWGWKNLLAAVGVSVLFSIFLPVPWFGLGLVIVIVTRMVLRRGSARAGLRPMKTSKKKEAEFAGTEKEKTTTEGEKDIPKETRIDKDIFPYISRIISLMSGDKVKDKAYAGMPDVQILLDSVFMITPSGYIPDTSKLKQELRLLVRNKLEGMELLDFDPNSAIKRLNDWKTKDNSDLADALDDVASEVASFISSRSTGEESGKEMLAIRELIGEYYGIDKNRFDEIHLRLVLFAMRSQVESDVKIKTVEAKRYYDLGKLEFHFHNYIAAEKAFGDAVREELGRPGADDLAADYLFALGYVQHYLWKLEGAKDCYKFSLNAREIKQHFTKLDEIKMEFTKLLIKKAEERISLEGDKIGDKDVRKKEAGEDGTGKSPAAIFSLKRWVAPKMPLDKYALKIAPWVEEGIFFALPLVLANFMFGLGSLGTVALMVLARGLFFFLHEGARGHAPPEKYIIPLVIAAFGILPAISLFIFAVTFNPPGLFIVFAYIGTALGHFTVNLFVSSKEVAPAVLEEDSDDIPQPARKSLKLAWKIKKELREKLHSLKGDFRHPIRNMMDISTFLLGLDPDPALTMYLMSKLQHANRRGEIEYANRIGELIYSLNFEKGAPGRKLIPRLFHSKNRSDIAMARYILKRLEDKSLYSIINSGTSDSHAIVRQRCLDLLSEMIAEDIGIESLIRIFERFDISKEKDRQDFIARAIAGSGEQGLYNIRAWQRKPKYFNTVRSILRQVKITRRISWEANAATLVHALKLSQIERSTEHLIPYWTFPGERVIPRRIFTEDFAAFANMNGETLMKIMKSLKGEELEGKSLREIEKWKDILERIKSEKNAFIFNWLGIWEGFECNLFAENAQRTLEALGMPYKKVRIRYISCPRKETLYHHYYTVVNILGEEFVLDTSADQFEIKVKRPHSYHPFKYHDLGVVLIPLKVVEQNKERFWMYLEGEMQVDESGHNRIESDLSKVDPARLTEALKEHLGFSMLSDKDAQVQILRYLEDKKYLMAVGKDGEIAGCLIFTFDEENLTARRMDIYVRCYQADRGIGRALWEEAKKWFIQKDVTKVEALCDRPVQKDFWEYIRERYSDPLEIAIRDKDEGGERPYSIFGEETQNRKRGQDGVARRPILYIAAVMAVLGLTIASLVAPLWRTKPQRPLPGTKIENPEKQEFQWVTVKRVIDGDTIVLDDGTKVRYIGIDSPETRRVKNKPTYFGKESKKFNEKLLQGRKVRLVLDVQEKDRYGRVLAYVYLPNGTFVNAKMVEEGYAQVSTWPPNVRHAELFLKLQQQAREKSKGLWGKPGKVPDIGTPKLRTLWPIIFAVGTFIAVFFGAPALAIAAETVNRTSAMGPMVLAILAIIFSFSWFASGNEGAGKGRGQPKDSPLVQWPELQEKFNVKKKIGAGGMGEVWLVYDVNLQRETALKILSDQSERARKRFVREIKRLRSLRHPNIIKILGSSPVRKDYKGPCYIVMEYVKGGSLEKFYRKRKYNNEKALLELISDVLLPVAKGIRYIHNKGIIHRDLTPENILISKTGIPKIADFGIAKLTEAAPGTKEQTLTQTSYIIGPPAYMAPETYRNMINTWIPDDIESRAPDKKSPEYEEWRKSPKYEEYKYLKKLKKLISKRQFRKISVQADIYSLGLIFCETCSGKLPFKYEGEDKFKMLQSKIFERVPLKEITPNLYNEFRKLIEDMVSIDPDERPSSKQLVRRLEKIEKKLKKRLEERKSPAFKTILKYAALIAAGVLAAILITYLISPGLIRSILNWLGIGFILTAGTMVSVTDGGRPGMESEELSRSNVKNLLALEDGLNDSSAEVRAGAIMKLAPIYTAFVNQDRDIRTRVFDLEQKLVDEYPSVREGAKAALESVYAAMAAKEKDAEFYGSRLKQRMDAHVWDISVRKSAAIALGILYTALVNRGKKVDVSPIKQRIRDSNMQVSEAAAGALSSIYVAQIKRGENVDISELKQRSNAGHDHIRKVMTEALGPIYKALIENGKQVDLSDLKERLRNDMYWKARQAAIRALGSAYVSLIERGRKEDIDLPLLRQTLNDIDLVVRKASISALGDVYIALIEQGEEVVFSDIEEKLDHYDEDVRKRAEEQLALIHDALEERGKEVKVSVPAEIGPVHAAEIEPGTILDPDYKKYLFWSKENFPYYSEVVDEYLVSSEPQIFISDLKRKTERYIQKGFDPDSQRQLWLAFVGVRLSGIDIAYHDFIERVEKLVEFDEKHPGYFSSLFTKDKGLKVIEIAAGEMRTVDTSEVDPAVLDNHLEELSGIKRRIDNCRWLSEEFPGHKYFNLRNLYYQLKRDQAKQRGEYTDGKFFIEFPSEGQMKEEIAGSRKLFYRIVFRGAYARLGDKEMGKKYLRLMRDLVISDILSDDAMGAQLRSSDPETRIAAFKAFYEDYKNHLPDAAELGVEKVKGLREALDELSREIYAEIAKAKVVGKRSDETYRLVPQGFLSVFRGRSGIIDCSFDVDSYGSAFTRAMHEDTGYYFVYSKKLKGYVGVCEGRTEEGEKVLTIDTINSPSLDGEELLVNLFIKLEDAAMDLGCVGIALPADMERSFNFDNEHTINDMEIYREATPIKVVPVHSRSWRRLVNMFGEDSYNSMKSGRFKLLDLGSMRFPAPGTKDYEDENIKIERVSAQDWEEIKEGIMKVERKTFSSFLRQTEESISETFKSPDSICLVLKDKDAIIGYIMGSSLEDYYYLGGVEEDPNYGKENTVYIESIAVLRSYQRSGLGKKLRDRFFEIARQKGYRHVSGHMKEKAARNRGDNILDTFGNWQGTGIAFCYYSNLIGSIAELSGQRKLSMKLFAELITKPLDYDWEAAGRVGELPDLKGLNLGKTNASGLIMFSPIKSYGFKLKMLGVRKESKGWEAVVEESGLKNGHFQFTVKLTKDGENPIYRVFQIGPHARDLAGRGKEEGKILKVWDVSHYSGLRVISELITKPADFDWEAADRNGKVPDLKGLKLGLTNARGIITFHPITNYPFEWTILGSREDAEGREAVITESSVQNGCFQFTVQFTKEGKKSVEKTFQIGPYIRNLFGRSYAKGKTCEVLDIDERSGIKAISELVAKPVDYDWEIADRAKKLPRLKGLRLGMVNAKGAINFSPVRYYSFQWNILGFCDDGWDAVITGSSVREGRFQITVELSKKGEKPIEKIFQIGPYTKDLIGADKEKGKIYKVLDIDSRPGLKALSELVTKPANYKWETADFTGELPNLKGLKLGKTKREGAITFFPIKEYQFQWHALGFKEEGWEAVIVESSVQGRYFQFVVEFTKEDRAPLYRIFQIGPHQRYLRNLHDKEQIKKRVLNIVSLDAIKRLAEKEYIKRRKGVWDHRTNGYDVLEPEMPEPLNILENAELFEKVEKISNGMDKEAQEIASLMMGGETDDAIVSENGYSEEKIQSIRMKLRNELGYFLGGYSQIGKHAVVKNIQTDEKTGEITAKIKIVDSDEEIPFLALAHKGKLDVRALRAAFKNMEEMRSTYNKDMILSILDLFEESPPEFYTYDVLVEDLFGFVSGEHNLIALHKSGASNPIAGLHEVGEYLIAKKKLKLKLRHERLVITVGEYGTFTLNLGGEALAIVRKNTASAHYLFRALQRQLFKEKDKDLTTEIKNEQKKKLSHSTIKNILAIERKLDDEDWRVYEAAIMTLTSIYILLIKQGKDVDLSAFKQKIKDKNWHVRKAAFRALDHICTVLGAEKKSADEETLGLVQEFKKTYRYYNIEVMPEPMDILLINLFKWGQMSLAELEQKAQSDDINVSEAATRALGSAYIAAFAANRISRWYLERQLNSKNWRIRKAAMAALSSIYADLIKQGEEVNLSVFERNLEHNYWQFFKDERISLDAVYISLVKEGKMSSSDIERKLEHRQLHVQEAAIKALGFAYMIEVKEGRVPLSALKQRLGHHKDWRVRRAVLSALEPFCIDAVKQGGVLDDDYEKYLAWRKEKFSYQEGLFSEFLASPELDDTRRSICSLFRQRILENVDKDVRPCLVNALIAASERKEKVVLALDLDLGEGQINGLLGELIRAIPALKDSNGDLKRFLGNLYVVKGAGEALGLRLDNITDPSRTKDFVKKENIIVVTKDSNGEYFENLKGMATITLVDDSAFPETAYLPLLEIMLFAVSKHLGWDKKNLLKYYKMIPNAVSIDDLNPRDYAGLFSGDEKYLVIRLIPDAVQFDKEELREIMDSIKVMLARA